MDEGMRFGCINLFCPICGQVFRYNLTQGTFHHREWGVICSRACFDLGELKYARMILGKDDA